MSTPRHFTPTGIVESAAARMADMIAAGRDEATCDLGGACDPMAEQRPRQIVTWDGTIEVWACDEHWAEYVERNDR